MHNTPKGVVRIMRSDNRIVIDPSDDKIKALICPMLTYVEKKYVRGPEAVKRRRRGESLWDETVWECWGEDFRRRIGTSFGFRERIVEVLQSRGYQVQTGYSSKLEATVARERLETVYKPRWERIAAFEKEGFKFRYMQREGLQIMAEKPCGRIDCPPGYGKGTMITLLAMLFPKAKIDVVADRVAVLHQRLYPELSANLPSVGMIGGGKRITGRRVMCYTADSLHHGRPDADFVLVDEGHEACADKFAGSLAMYRHARMWAFSASWDMRLDNKDMRAEAMFGPIRLVVSYQEAEAHGLVSPMEVHWTDVNMSENPCEGIQNDVEKKRRGFWRNEYRNKLIARDARRYDDQTQVLIPVETLEHALALKKELPEFRLVYAPGATERADMTYLANEGLIYEGFKPLTEELKAKRTRMFTAGTLKKVIVTTVWNVGVDFRHLQVLCRADGGGSPINDTQIPGRVSRTNKELKRDGKTIAKGVGIIHDYGDQFDGAYGRRAKRREKNYAKHGWKQIRRGRAVMPRDDEIDD